ncbi:MAG: hypothetical protein ABIJ09_02750 [Pseudomonadota bacterium]
MSRPIQGLPLLVALVLLLALPASTSPTQVPPPADGFAAYDSYVFNIEICLRGCRQAETACNNRDGEDCNGAYDLCYRHCYLMEKHKNRRRLVELLLPSCKLPRQQAIARL